MTERSRSGKTAWDKEKTRELFRRYKETGDPDAREQLVMSHMNLVRCQQIQEPRRATR